MHASRRLGLSWLVCLTLLIAPLANVSATSGSGWEIDEMGTVTRILDGDTFVADPGGRVRLADVDAAENGEQGATQATDQLRSLVHLRRVYLDLDSLRGRDIYGRLVAVVYVRHNATHLLNVNQALLDAAVVEVRNFVNDFDPQMWTRFVYYPRTHPETNDVPLAAWMLGAGFISFEIIATLLRAWREDRRNSRASETKIRRPPSLEVRRPVSSWTSARNLGT